MDQEFLSVLGKMGFSKGGGTSEVILTTVNPDSSHNAAPMGICLASSGLLEIRPFKSSSTYRNLCSNPKACINVTDDPDLFFLTAFKDQTIEGFSPPSIDDEMRLTPALAHIFVEVTETQDSSEIRACFTCCVIKIEAPTTIPRAFSRGRAEAIEAIIHVTRIEVFSREGRLDDVERLIKRFAECKVVVERVSAPESVENRVVGALDTMIAVWRGKV
jgi:hypothetical protein